MSTDYSKMSDFEINCRVHSEVMEISGLDTFKAKDYCNSPADAWPVVEQNKITMMHECDEWTAFGNLSIHHSGEANWEFCEYDKKPFRAAMIVFLMMQEKSNGG